MILGIGNDITDIRRIEKSLARFGVRFEQKVFSAGERQKADSRRKAGQRAVATTYAKRFAAKEACAKALGTGVNAGVHLKDMEVVNLQSGKPTMRLSNGALAQLVALTPLHMQPLIHLSITDEYPYAQAQVIIEAAPFPPGTA